MAEKMDWMKVVQQRVLGRDDVGRRNKSEEGKNSNAKQRDGYGPGLLFLGKSLRWIGAAGLFERIMKGEEALKKGHSKFYPGFVALLFLFRLPYCATPPEC